MCGSVGKKYEVSGSVRHLNGRQLGEIEEHERLTAFVVSVTIVILNVATCELVRPTSTRSRGGCRFRISKRGRACAGLKGLGGPPIIGLRNSRPRMR